MNVQSSTMILHSERFIPEIKGKSLGVRPKPEQIGNYSNMFEHMFGKLILRPSVEKPSWANNS